MGFFTKLEKLSEKYIEGFFRTKFAGHIQPVEIAKLLWREMRDNLTVSIAKIYVPNEYTVFVGSEDWKTIESVHQSLSKELQEFLNQKAADRGYELMGEIGVVLKPAEDLPLGTVFVESCFTGGFPTGGPEEQGLGEQDAAEHGGIEKSVTEHTLIVDRERLCKKPTGLLPQDTLTRKTAAVRKPGAELVEKTGMRQGAGYPLSTRCMIIGRRNSNDICLEDSNVSRVHVSIDYVDGDYYITDLGSTNGTFVNEIRVSKKKLTEGDRIRLGTTVLEFRVV